MKKIITGIFLLFLSLGIGYYSYMTHDGNVTTIGMFLSGTIFGIFIMIIKINSKNDKINSYQRELEKESISSDEATARVKVLESKIQVLEKALENALNK